MVRRDSEFASPQPILECCIPQFHWSKSSRSERILQNQGIRPCLRYHCRRALKAIGCKDNKNNNNKKSIRIAQMHSLYVMSHESTYSRYACRLLSMHFLTGSSSKGIQSLSIYWRDNKLNLPPCRPFFEWNNERLDCWTSTNVFCSIHFRKASSLTRCPLSQAHPSGVASWPEAQSVVGL